MSTDLDRTLALNNRRKTMTEGSRPRQVRSTKAASIAISLSAALGFLCQISGCALTTGPAVRLHETRVESFYSGAYVSVAVLEPIQWHAIAEDLRPKFNITSANLLLDQAMPIVGSETSRRSRRASLDLQLAIAGLQQEHSDILERTTRVDSDGEETSESERIQREATSRNTPETISIEPATLQSLLSAATPTTPGAYDPSLKYRAAASLFQSIKLLDRYLDTTHSRAQLIRLQVTVSPFARMQPYDVYTSVTIARDDPSSNSDPASKEICNHSNRNGSRDIRMFPIVIAENIEGVTGQSAVESISAMTAGIGARAGTVAAAAAYNRVAEEVLALAGQSINPLVTYSQPNSRTLMLRFGAPFHPRSGFSMRARTYDVVFVVVDPEACEEQIKYDLFHWSEMRHSQSGVALPAISKGDIRNLTSRLRESLLNRGLLRKGNTNLSEAFSNKLSQLYIPPMVPGRDVPSARDCRRLYSDSDLEQLTNTFIFQGPDNECLSSLIYEAGDYILDAEFIRARDSASYSNTTIQTQNHARLPPEQIGTYIDDGREAVVSFSGVLSYDSRNPLAWIFLIKNTQDLSPSIRSSRTESSGAKNGSVEARFRKALPELSQNTSVSGPIYATTARLIEGRLDLRFPSLQSLGFSRTDWDPIVFVEDQRSRVSSENVPVEAGIYPIRFQALPSAASTSRSSYRVTSFGTTQSTVDGEKTLIATFLAERIAAIPIPEAVSKYRFVISGAPVKRVEKIGDDGAVVSGAVVQRMQRSAAEVNSLPGRYRIIFDSADAKHGEIRVAIVGLTTAEERIESEADSLVFPAKKE